MVANLKPLIVVLVIAALVFRLLQPYFLSFIAPEDFSRRRNVWFAVTVIEFMSPSIWIYFFLAAPLLFWAGRRDKNPICLYLLLFAAVPPLAVEIPLLFPIDTYRLLALLVIIPASLRFRKVPLPRGSTGWRAMCALIVGYGILKTALFLPPDLPDHTILSDSATNVVRRAVLFFIDAYLLFWVTFRSASDRRRMVEMLAVYCLSCCVLGALAIFETGRHWLLYTNINYVWFGSVVMYAIRGNALRASVSSGSPLSLGYMFAIACGFWQFLKRSVSSKAASLGVDVLLWLGLLAAYARGPWIGAFAIYVFNMALSPGAFRRIVKAVAIGGVLFAVLLTLPIGARIVQGLPFFGGSVKVDTIDYRQRLLDISMNLIYQSPFFGDQLAFTKMEDMRQGEGIIDLTNSYLEVALNYGLVGLTFFSGVLIVGLLKTYRTSRALTKWDMEGRLLGDCLMACVIGTLIMLADNAFLWAYEKLYYVLAGLMGAYVSASRIQLSRRTTTPSHR